MMGDLVDGDDGGEGRRCDGRDERPPGNVPPFTRAMASEVDHRRCGGRDERPPGDTPFLQRV